MKYDAEIDPDDETTSHALVARLVGAHKRVLDVGCASGRLAEHLQRSGNRVSGVEIDPDLGEAARVHLERLVIGDLDKLDLADEFGGGSFDVVVFADVLEHLKNPLRTLRQARELLADGGYTVVSIPNIAHGSVRLALLQGRFEYRELGLLDDTHLRFFTRSSVDAFLRAGGFVPSVSLQTTAGPFETEIPLRPGDFSASALEQVERDPESRVYQFVIRALPVGNGQDDDAAVTELLAKDREVHRLRGELASVARHLEGSPRAPVIGLLDGTAPASELPALTRLRVATSLAEIRRRLTGFSVQAYWLGDEPSETGLAGEPARPLLPWDAGRADQLRAEVDALVIIQGTSPAPELGSIVDDLIQRGCPVYGVVLVVPTDAATPPSANSADKMRPGESPPVDPRGPQPALDPIALASRLVATGTLSQRAEYLRILGDLPEADGFVLASLAIVDRVERERAQLALKSLARRANLAVVTIGVATDESGSPAGISGDADVVPIDLLAIVASASLVVTDSPALLALAAGMERPVFGVTSADSETTFQPRILDVPVGHADELLARAPIAAADGTTGTRADLIGGTLEMFFDELTSDLVGASVQRLSRSLPNRFDELVERARHSKPSTPACAIALSASEPSWLHTFGRSGIARRIPVGSTTRSAGSPTSATRYDEMPGSSNGSRTRSPPCTPPVRCGSCVPLDACTPAFARCDDASGRLGRVAARFETAIRSGSHGGRDPLAVHRAGRRHPGR